MAKKRRRSIWNDKISRCLPVMSSPAGQSQKGVMCWKALCRHLLNCLPIWFPFNIKWTFSASPFAWCFGGYVIVLLVQISSLHSRFLSSKTLWIRKDGAWFWVNSQTQGKKGIHRTPSSFLLALMKFRDAKLLKRLQNICFGETHVFCHSCLVTEGTHRSLETLNK